MLAAADLYRWSSELTRVCCGASAASLAALIISADLRSLAATSKAILLNKAAIAVDQDELGKMGRLVNTTDGFEVWAKELAGGDVAVAILNKNRGAPGGVQVVEDSACEPLPCSSSSPIGLLSSGTGRLRE